MRLSDATDDDAEYFREPADERTSLLPPSGISTHERGDWKEPYTENRKAGQSSEWAVQDPRSNRPTSVRSKDSVRTDIKKVEELFGSGKVRVRAAALPVTICSFGLTLSLGQETEKKESEPESQSAIQRSQRFRRGRVLVTVA